MNKFVITLLVVLGLAVTESVDAAPYYSDLLSPSQHYYRPHNEYTSLAASSYAGSYNGNGYGSYNGGDRYAAGYTDRDYYNRYPDRYQDYNRYQSGVSGYNPGYVNGYNGYGSGGYNSVYSNGYNNRGSGSSSGGTWSYGR